jgi:hypothetical protein
MPQREAQPSAEQKRRFRWKLGWYAVPAVLLLVFTAWLLMNMAQAGGSALIRVLLGIVVVLVGAAVMFKAIERLTNLD